MTARGTRALLSASDTPTELRTSVWRLPAARPVWLRPLYWDVAKARQAEQSYLTIAGEHGLSVAQVKQIEVKVERMLRRSGVARA